MNGSILSAGEAAAQPPPLLPPPQQLELQLQHLQQHTPTRTSGGGKKTLAEAQDVFISVSSSGSTASIGASSFGAAFSTFSSAAPAAAAPGAPGVEGAGSTSSSSISSQLKRDLAAQVCSVFCFVFFLAPPPLSVLRKAWCKHCLSGR